MPFYKEITFLDVEPTSYCNLKCPKCMRESRNGDYSFFKQVHLDSTFFECFIPEHIIKGLQYVSFSGNIGEPAMNKHLPEIIRYFRKVNPNIFVEVYTNGGVQNSDWWHELGTSINTNGNVIFALDGLEDTNHIYRVNAKWKQTIDNVKGYITSGAPCTWQFIPFKHNEHQVEEARQMSKELGFTDFKIKISHRDLLSQPHNNTIFPPENPEYQHHGQELDLTKLDKVEKYLNSVDIKCYAIENGNVYINADGQVFPCCHTASIVLLDDDFIPEPYSWIKNVKQDFDLEEINLYKNSFEDIINSKTFNRIKQSWQMNMQQGRNPLCAAICGKCENNKSLYEGLKNE